MLKKIQIENIQTIVQAADDVIMEIYQKNLGVEYKDDKSLLTEADFISNEVSIKALSKYHFPIMSEGEKEWDTAAHVSKLKNNINSGVYVKNTELLYRFYYES